jgi:hypothetical protein
MFKIKKNKNIFVLFSKREEGGVRGTLVPWFLKVDKSG